MSSTQLAPMASIQEKVKERIQATFVDLIPQEMWEGMVQQHLDEFVKQQLPRIIKEAAEARLKEQLKLELNKPEWNSFIYDTMGNRPSEMVLEIVKQAAPELVANFFGRMTQNVVMEIRSNPGRY